MKNVLAESLARWRRTVATPHRYAKWAKMLGHKLTIYGRANPKEQRRIQAEVSHSKAVIGWDPRTSFCLADSIRLGGDVFAKAHPAAWTIGDLR